MLNIQVNLVTALASFSRAGDLNDLTFLAHAERVAYTAFRLGKTLGLSEHDLEELLLSSLLHDIGGVITTEEKLRLADLEPQRGGITALHCQRGGSELVRTTGLLAFSADHILEHHDYYSPGMNIIPPAIIHMADRIDLILKKKTAITCGRSRTF